MTEWGLFRRDEPPRDWQLNELPKPPPWRTFGAHRAQLRGSTFVISKDAQEMVNAALVLRRPLLITGKPGTGKSSLTWAVAYKLGLGDVLEWPINTRSTLLEGEYRYDAIARLQDAGLQRAGTDGAPSEPPEIGEYITLGALGTALLPSDRPRVLLVDEIDKSDLDLPNDLLNVFEEGGFTIPELGRLKDQPSVTVRTHDGATATIERGRVQCTAFPFVLLTSNAEREFPPAFLRRCLRLTMQPPLGDELEAIVKEHFSFDGEKGTTNWARAKALMVEFENRARNGDLATDQLLNAVHMTLEGVDPLAEDRKALLDTLFRTLSTRRTNPTSA
jgi:MoxR-like ATPase